MIVRMVLLREREERAEQRQSTVSLFFLFRPVARLCGYNTQLFLPFWSIVQPSDFIRHYLFGVSRTELTTLLQNYPQSKKLRDQLKLQNLRNPLPQ